MLVPFPTHPTNSPDSAPPSSAPSLTLGQQQQVRDMIDKMQRLMLDKPHAVAWLVAFNLDFLVRQLHE